jgi:excisionase family DNA binding protein
MARRHTAKAPDPAAGADLRELLASLPPSGAAQVTIGATALSLPEPAVRVLRVSLEEALSGAVGPVERAILTTQQAADFLHVSRPFVVKLLESGEIPFHKVGNRRRLYTDDLLAYRTARDAGRHAKLVDLSRESQRLGLE